MYFDYMDAGHAKKIIDILEKIPKKYHKFHTCDVTILDETRAELFCSKNGKRSIVNIAPNTHLVLTCCDQTEFLTDYQIRPVQLDGRLLFALPLADRCYVPMLKRDNRYQMVALIVKGLKRLDKGEYHIDVYQEDLTGRLQGGVNFIIRKS